MFNTNASGANSLVYSSFLGGSRQDEGEAIALDPAGNLSSPAGRSRTVDASA